MGKVRVYFDRVGNSLSVWFDDPNNEHICEETDDDIILIKDRRGRVIGFERLNYLSSASSSLVFGVAEVVRLPNSHEFGYHLPPFLALKTHLT